MVLLCLPQTLVAQEPTQPATTETLVMISPTDSIEVRGYVQVPLRLEKAVSSASAHRGDHIRLILQKSLTLDGKVVAIAGTAFDAEVASVRSKAAERPGKLDLSDAQFTQSNGKKILLRRHDPQSRLGPSSIPAITLEVVLLVPLIVALLPVQVPYLLYKKRHEPQQKLTVRSPKPEPEDITFEAGDIVNYYADRVDLMRRQP